jgi:hypothetical protein
MYAYNCPPVDEHIVARNMYRIQISILQKEETVRQVGYLPELYEDALDLNYMIQFLHAYS